MESTETPSDSSPQIARCLRGLTLRRNEKVRDLEERDLEVEEGINVEVNKTEKSNLQEGSGYGKMDESWKQSPKELQFGQVTITPSRYAALHNLEDSKEDNTVQEEEPELREDQRVEEMNTKKSKVVESEGGRQILPRNSKHFIGSSRICYTGWKWVMETIGSFIMLLKSGSKEWHKRSNES
ncbi:hypothetical protein Bca52824_003813 [Brassica carinata]|uniref:Uncharacterized protein n=1 Tax=Brassica carinata TaxID=52824 RepID=A0A8X8BFK6_BRACI|nr:hypothetical protein Bca52824_003813 [Brassica carinata]